MRKLNDVFVGRGGLGEYDDDFILDVILIPIFIRKKKKDNFNPFGPKKLTIASEV